MERIGIYGGSFNPPHVGHIQAAKQAVHALQLSKLYVIPAGVAPHKELPPNSPTPEQRLQMLRIALADCPNVEVSAMELERQGASYTYETVLTLKQQHPEDELVLLMGTDMFLSFPTWKTRNAFWKMRHWAFFTGAKRAKRLPFKPRRKKWKPGA